MPNNVYSLKGNKARETHWDIVCEPAILEKLKTEERFWQVIALACSVNALSFAHWAMFLYWTMTRGMANVLLSKGTQE